MFQAMTALASILVFNAGQLRRLKVLASGWFLQVRKTKWYLSIDITETCNFPYISQILSKNPDYLLGLEQRNNLVVIVVTLLEINLK